MSVLNVDTIANAAGSGPVALTKQEAGKYWVNFNGSGTVATRDSFNHSSLTDDGVGIYTISYTNSFNNASYCAACGQDDNAGSIAVPRQSTDLGTGSTGVRTTNGSAGSDQTYIHVALFGDLA